MTQGEKTRRENVRKACSKEEEKQWDKGREKYVNHEAMEFKEQWVAIELRDIIIQVMK